MNFQDQILAESRSNGFDILQSDLRESYLNLTFKVALGLEWIAAKSNPVLVLKVDDDVMVNPARVWQMFEEFTAAVSPPDMMGTLIAGRPMRSPKSKWFLPFEFYEVYSTGRTLQLSRQY